MGILIYLIGIAFNIAYFIIIAQAAISWLVAFDIIKTSSPQAQNLIQLLHRATEPVYSRIRKYIPTIGGIDLTPLVVFIALSVTQRILVGFLYQLSMPAVG